MNEDLLIVEDLMLLLLSEDGNSVAGAAVLDYALAGAVLVELAHLERLEVHSHHRTKGTLIRAQRDASAIDPLLAQALESLGRKEYSARTLIPTLIDSLETGLKELVLERLSDREIVDRQTKRRLGLIPATRWPLRQPHLRVRLGSRISDIVTAEGHVLTGDGRPDLRGAAIIGLLSACRVYSLLAPDLPWNPQIAKRIRAIEKGTVSAPGTASAIKEISDELARAVSSLAGARSSAPIL